VKESLILQAFRGSNPVVPVWFMRQAGRYLPEYRKIKEKYSLQEMFHTPSLAAEITCQPIDILGVDAAILFADILSLPAEMGFQIKFENHAGPVIAPFTDIHLIHDFENLDYIKETISLVKQRLPKGIPLIGFAGSPFTVATYLLEGGSSLNFAKTFQVMYEKKERFHQLMDLLTSNTIRYLNLQKQAGIDIFQIFDTWAGILRPADYAHFVLPHVKQIFKKVDLPSIYYVKNAGHLLPLIDRTSADFLSVCHTVVLGHHAILNKTRKGVQGNLFNGLLFADKKTIETEVTDVIKGASKHDRFIFNLSHGILPDMDVNKCKFVVECVHQHRWKQ